MDRDENVSENENQYLTFRLGSEMYGLPISVVREVIEYNRISPVPLVNHTIKGVMNLRGSVITVIDLSARFYGRTMQNTDQGVVIITEMEDDGQPVLIGMLIDGVNAVVDLPVASVEDEPEFGAKIRSDFISQIGKKNGEFIIILNSKQVLNLDEMSNLNSRRADAQMKQHVSVAE